MSLPAARRISHNCHGVSKGAIMIMSRSAIATSGGLVFASGSDGTLRVIDVTDPSAPRELGRAPPDPDPDEGLWGTIRP
jgi:hypothetical protein